MDFHAETENRKQLYQSQIVQLAYERYGLCKQIESNQKRIVEIDGLIAEKEMAVHEDEQAQRNFNTYLSIKENAVTLEQIKDSVEDGTNIKTEEARNA